nr:MAG: RNA dependent RNA polymerase [Leviviridae sp.]
MSEGPLRSCSFGYTTFHLMENFMAFRPEVLSSCLDRDLLRYGPIPIGLYPGMTTFDAARFSVRESLLKKFTSSIHPDANDRARDKFLTTNKRCGEWSPVVIRENNYFDELFCGTFRTVLHEFWNRGNMFPLTDHPFDILANAKVGPGANLLANGGSFYSKLFSSRLSCSSLDLYTWYTRYIAKFPEWATAESIRTANYGEPHITTDSRLSFVPKNDEISRCICIEPTLNTYFQLGFAHIIERRLEEKFGISLQSQPTINRDLAQLGSLTNGLVTIDLASASDSISIRMLEHFFPRDFVAMLKKYRTPNVNVPGVGRVKLEMISTMGNGYTFPLQTVIFAAAVTACLRIRGIPETRDSSTNLWSVFGDDIVCPSSVARDVIAGLQALGFVVNSDKSFTDGPFRESCGEDFYNGVNIRGVYLKRVDTPSSFFSAINQLTRFSVRTGVILKATIKYLLSFVDTRLMVPPYEDMSAGLHVPRSIARPRLDRNGSDIYSALVAQNRYVTFDSEVPRVYVPGWCKPLTYNPSGVMVSLLQGSLSGGIRNGPSRSGARCPIRVDRLTYRKKRRVAPNWDWHELDKFRSRSSTDYGLSWQRWRTAVALYLRA